MKAHVRRASSTGTGEVTGTVHAWYDVWRTERKSCFCSLASAGTCGPFDLIFDSNTRTN